MAGKHRRNFIGAGAKVATGGLIGVLADVVAVFEAENVGEKEARVVALRLNEEKVGVRVGVLVLLEPRLLARVDDGAEGLRQHRRKAAVGESGPGVIVTQEPVSVLLELDVDWNDGVDAEKEIGPGVKRHARVYCAAGDAINVVPAINFDRGVEPGKCG